MHTLFCCFSVCVAVTYLASDNLCSSGKHDTHFLKVTFDITNLTVCMGLGVVTRICVLRAPEAEAGGAQQARG